MCLRKLLQLEEPAPGETELAAELGGRRRAPRTSPSRKVSVTIVFFSVKAFSVDSTNLWIAPRPLRPNPGDIPRGHRDISGSAGQGGTPAGPKTSKPKVSPKIMELGLNLAK